MSVVCRSVSIGVSLSCTQRDTDAVTARILSAASARNLAVNTIDSVARRTPCSRLPADTVPGSSETGSCRHVSGGRFAANNAPFQQKQIVARCIIHLESRLQYQHVTATYSVLIIIEHFSGAGQSVGWTCLCVGKIILPAKAREICF